MLGVSHSPARELEGLPSAVARLLSNRSLPGLALREKVSFNLINRKTGNRLKQQNVDSEAQTTSSRGRTLREGMRSAKANMSSSKTRSSRPFNLKARAHPSQFEERYETALIELLKEAGEKIEPAKAGPAPACGQSDGRPSGKPRLREEEGTGPVFRRADPPKRTQAKSNSARA